MIGYLADNREFDPGDYGVMTTYKRLKYAPSDVQQSQDSNSIVSVVELCCVLVVGAIVVGYALNNDDYAG